jgi:rhamnosyltransferase
VIIRDDCSTDATLEEIAQFKDSGRVRQCPAHLRAGSAAKNFFALIASTPGEEFDFIAFADQDDIWRGDRLARACRLLRAGRSVGYSSATVALWPNGRTTTLKQRQRQTAADFLFEGAGQGCTFVVRADFYQRVRRFVRDCQDLIAEAHYHDWTIYALARAWGELWVFDDLPTVTYRQHDANDTGARRSASGISRRIGLIRKGWYKSQLSAIAAICAAAAPADATVADWRSLFRREDGWSRRLQIARFCMSRSRRKAADRAVVVAAGLLGWI